MSVASLQHLKQLDDLIAASLKAFAADTLGSRWCGKEHDWVNTYAHSYLLKECAPTGPLYDAGQVTIEVGVPQPPGYTTLATRRDLVIWAHPGVSCWGEDWRPIHHPLAILEWKVHRLGRRNRKQPQEREWLRRYTQWQAAPVAYAVEINLDCTPSSLTCSRFHAGSEILEWLRLTVNDFGVLPCSPSEGEL